VVHLSSFHTFDCQFFTFPVLIIVGQHCLLSDAHNRFTCAEINTPETQQTNPQLTDAGCVLTLPSLLLQPIHNGTHSQLWWFTNVHADNTLVYQLFHYDYTEISVTNYSASSSNNATNHYVDVVQINHVWICFLCQLCLLLLIIRQHLNTVNTKQLWNVDALHTHLDYSTLLTPWYVGLALRFSTAARS